jgi:hypothetical protein
MNSTLLRAFLAASAAFFAWTTDLGVLSFTDDPKRIPAAYKDTAVERTWEDLRAATDPKWTVDMSRPKED